jgi:hypothetical protein
MNYTEIIITYYKDSSTFNQIAFLIYGIYDTVQPFELKYHSEYLNLDITTFKQI